MTGSNLKAIAPELRRPFTSKALQWKIQAASAKGGLVVCYIDRGLVIDRLNVLGPDLWSATFADAGGNQMVCRLTVDGVTREDVGEGSMLKARYSDALKRAAVHFGVGVSLARVPKSWLSVERGHIEVWEKNGRWSGRILQPGLDYLRARYETWLRVAGRDTFGDPLEHGDTGEGEAQGDDEVASDLVEPDEKMALYERLTGDRTMRRVRGLLNAAGVPGLALEIRPEDAERAVSGLTGEQAERLRALMDKLDEGAPDAE